VQEKGQSLFKITVNNIFSPEGLFTDVSRNLKSEGRKQFFYHRDLSSDSRCRATANMNMVWWLMKFLDTLVSL